MQKRCCLATCKMTLAMPSVLVPQFLGHSGVELNVLSLSGYQYDELNTL